MKYQKFIDLLKKPPMGLNYNQIKHPPVKSQDKLKRIRDSLVENLVLHAAKMDALHQHSQLKDLLSSVGLHLKIKEEQVGEKNHLRIIVNHQDLNILSGSLNFLLDWEHANTASYLTLMSIVEHQMQQHLQALQQITSVLDSINPNIIKFISQYPSDIDLVEFAHDFCVIQEAIQSKPGFKENIQFLHHSGDKMAAGFEAVNSELSSLLDHDSDKIELWSNLFQSIDTESLFVLEPQIQQLKSAVHQAKASTAVPFSQKSTYDKESIAENKSCKPMGMNPS